MKPQGLFPSLTALLAACAGLASALVAREDIERPATKYFHEDRHSDHYDARFKRDTLNETSHQAVVKTLVQTYLSTFRDLGVETWLMHGTLLGWWWGKRVMPWDFDADVQVSEADMFFLAAYYNMTTYYFKYGDMEQGRFYQLEVNPHYKYREEDDKLNVIDARWIDMATGLYIDITAARYAIGHEKGEGILYDKSGHEYRDTYVFPLRDTTFEGVPAKIPFRYKQMLIAEYGEEALTDTDFNGHRFNSTSMEWVKVEDGPGEL